MAPSIRIKNISELPIISGSRNDTRKKISCITIGQREALLSGIDKQKNSFRQISIWTLLSSYWFYPEKDIP